MNPVLWPGRCWISVTLVQAPEADKELVPPVRQNGHCTAHEASESYTHASIAAAAKLIENRVLHAH